MTAAFSAARLIATPVLLSALLGATPAFAAELLPLTAAQKTNLGIATVAAAANTASPALTYPARVTLPPASVRVVAAAGAGLVTQIYAQAGDTVKRGAPLVTLSMPGLADAQNALTQARLKSQLAASNAARDQKLFAEGLIAESRLRATQSETQSARASLVAAQTTLSMLGAGKVSGSTITLTAPMAGVILESAAEPGERVDAGMALIKVADLSKLALEIPLSTAQARQVAVGQAVTVADSPASGRVTALLPQLNASQSVLARASLVDPQKLLRPGQSVQVGLAGAQSAQGLAVPAAALVWKASVPYVFVETAKGFTPVAVKLVRQNASQAEVTGLAAGSRVAVKGVAALKAQWLGE
ncbi:MAG TPA: efflux RND transporter periplasmic adaptor subunit [Thiobacillus sp.]|nr:MAG: efflux transporter periplasmic adaptor subunit [Hydrogenophilales bacterium 28-61-11]OYZ56184.1 MAG: efflux transporter periplasmic adaptor subunit [Hydrogenophilales bacterium 16-61-112]HQT29879.1 efflux RND transporter periplasmic adaptor subunit [Thiobacillus sp.]HQT69394.1 efflux RND transporter periplasmic adaptor subunit [Thiobacillus sp.]